MVYLWTFKSGDQIILYKPKPLSEAFFQL